MPRVPSVVISSFLVIAGSMFVRANTIALASNPSPDPGGLLVSSSEYVRTSWSQSGGYTNVAISAWLFGTVVNGQYVPSSGTAYLTSSLPGVSLQDAFVFPDPTGGHATSLLLFSGLNLGAGTYFLTLAGVDPLGGGWSDSLNGGPGTAITLDYGVTLGTPGFASPATLNASNPPASMFNTINPTSLQPFFAVTGDPVPEPSLIPLVGSVIAMLLALRMRRTRK